MKKLKTALQAVAFAAMVAGCATVKYSNPGMLDRVSVKGVEGKRVGQMVVIDTSGYYFLWTIPLVSGDLKWDPNTKSIVGGPSFFSDQVGVEELKSALLKIAESRNCDLAEVYLFDADASYAGASYGGLIGTLFGSSHMSMSALLIPRTATK